MSSKAKPKNLKTDVDCFVYSGKGHFASSGSRKQDSRPKEPGDHQTGIMTKHFGLCQVNPSKHKGKQYSYHLDSGGECSLLGFEFSLKFKGLKKKNLNQIFEWVGRLYSPNFYFQLYVNCQPRSGS